MIPYLPAPRFAIGPVTFGPVTVMALFGMTLATMDARARASARGVSPRSAIDLLFAVAIAALLGAHIVALLERSRSQSLDAGAWMIPGEAGYSSLGAILGGGIVTGVWLAWRRMRDLAWTQIDGLVRSLILAATALRAGCFAAHEHLGRRSDSLLAVAFPGGARHDLGLDEMLLLLGLFACIRVLDRERSPIGTARPGTLALLSAAVYSAGRFGLEFLRAGKTRPGPSFAQWALLALFAAALAGLLIRATSARH